MEARSQPRRHAPQAKETLATTNTIVSLFTTPDFHNTRALARQGLLADSNLSANPIICHAVWYGDFGIHTTLRGGAASYYSNEADRRDKEMRTIAEALRR